MLYEYGFPVLRQAQDRVARDQRADAQMKFADAAKAAGVYGIVLGLAFFAICQGACRDFAYPATGGAPNLVLSGGVC